MAHPYPQIVEKCRGRMIAVEPLRGRGGLRGLAICSGDDRFLVRRDDWGDGFLRELLTCTEEPISCFDVRRIIDMPLPERPVHDVRLVWGGDRTLLAVMREAMPDAELTRRLIGLEQRVTAHSRAARTAHVDAGPEQFLPPELLEDWTTTRAACIHALDTAATLSSGSPGIMLGEVEDRWPFIRALREVELAGIHVDIDFVKEKLRQGSNTPDLKALRSLEGLYRDGFVTSLFNPVGGKTGRVRLEGGFNCMGIPKEGFARSALTSRHPGGLIYTFDYNAIDYRCIVASIGGEFAELYRGYDDFHFRTASFLFPPEQIGRIHRDTIKFVSYVYIYGGSDETLSERTGLTVPQVRRLLELLDQHIGPIKRFREGLHNLSRRQGYITLPNGKEMYTTEADGSPMHDGKVIGLYAQTYSSVVFEAAFVRVHRLLSGTRSNIIFSVHDELVIDMHPDDIEHGLPGYVREAMQEQDFVVKIKKGRSYGEVE